MLGIMVKTLFAKNLNFFVFFYCFDMLVKYKKYYFYIFLNKK